jgi:hypothetical protein
MSVKFPEVEVQLVGLDGNAFSILGRVAQAMRRAGISKEDIDAYHADATSDDYNHLLRVTMETVTCDPYDEDDEDWGWDDEEDEW